MDSFSHILDEHTASRRATELKLSKAIEEKCDLIRDEILREREIRNENLDRLREYQEVEIPNIRETLAMTISEREEMDQALIKQTSDEFIKIRESLEEEQRAREEGEDEIHNYLQEVLEQCQSQIANEKAEREKMEESLMVLLEATCSQLNSAVNF